MQKAALGEHPSFARTRPDDEVAPIPDASRPPPGFEAVRPLAAARASRTHRVAFRSLAGRKPGNSGGRLAGTYLAEWSPPPAGGSGASRCPANQLGHIECRDRPPNVRFAIGREKAPSSRPANGSARSGSLIRDKENPGHQGGRRGFLDQTLSLRGLADHPIRVGPVRRTCPGAVRPLAATNIQFWQGGSEEHTSELQSQR